MRRRFLLAAAVALLATNATRAEPQSIPVNAGTAPNIRVLPGARFVVPISVDLSNAAPMDIASLTTALSWGTPQLSLDSLRAAPNLGWQFTANTSGAPGGSASFTTSNASSLTSSSIVALAYYTANSVPGGTRITPAVPAASNAAMQSILPFVRPRRLDVCIAVHGKWGDVNSDNAVNIIDAQQVARYSVGLAVFDINAVVNRGDVTNDGLTNIIDAQQVARFSVSLPVGPRPGVEAFVQPVPVSATMSPAGQQTLDINQTVQLTASPFGSSLVPQTGCESFLWSSSNPNAATVNASGFVTALATGSATITATSLSNPSLSVSVPVVVGIPPVIRVNIAHTGRPAKQYIAEVTSGDFSSAEGFVLNGTNMNGGVLDIPRPAAGSYAVRIVAIDAASTADPMVIAGGWFNVTVPSTGTVERSVTLTAPTYSNVTIPSSARLGTPITVGWRVTDPANIIDGPVRGVLFCGTIHSNLNTFATDFSGAQSSACGVTLTGEGILSFSNSTTPLAGQIASGTLRVQLRATQFIRTGIGSATDILVHWLSPSVMRGDAPYSIVLPPVLSVQVTPDNPLILAGTTQQFTALAFDQLGALSGLPVTWSTLPTSFATITQTGVATGITNGQVTVSATVGGTTGSTQMTVGSSVNVGSISVSVAPTLGLRGVATAVATVTDAVGNVLPNVALTWGSSNYRVARAGEGGALQAIGSGTTEITASFGNKSGSATLTVPAASSSYDIAVRTRGSITPSVATALNTAASRWAQIVRGDLPDVVTNSLDVSACLSEAAGTTTLNESIDDVIIYASVATIDGTGGVLAQAGPCVTRSTNGLTLVGTITIDASDAAAMQSDGSLNAVVLHEMGHVLGIGTLWDSFVANPAQSPGTGDPTFTGTNARWAFAHLGTGYSGNSVPVENCCGGGTRNSHWRESVLARELMTPFITISDINPLSSLTAASLLDLGYVADVNQSDAPPAFLRSNTSASLQSMPINERLLEPRIRVNAQGIPEAGIRPPTIRQ